EVARPDRLPQSARKQLERAVPGEMSVTVVELLEFVDVEECHTERPTIADRTPELLLDPLEEGASLGQPGEMIGPDHQAEVTCPSGDRDRAHADRTEDDNPKEVLERLPRTLQGVEVPVPRHVNRQPEELANYQQRREGAEAPVIAERRV